MLKSIFTFCCVIILLSANTDSKDRKDLFNIFIKYSSPKTDLLKNENIVKSFSAVIWKKIFDQKNSSKPLKVVQYKKKYWKVEGNNLLNSKKKPYIIIAKRDCKLIKVNGGIVPKEGVIDNKDLLIQIAELLWVSEYGNEIFKYKPYQYEYVRRNIWEIHGKDAIGSCPFLGIDQYTCKVYYIDFGL